MQKDQLTNYIIYPRVQKIEYREGTIDLRGSINLIVEGKIDSFSLKKAQEILNKHRIKYSISNEMKEGKLNFFLGVYGSKEILDSYVEDSENTDFNKIDAYHLRIDEDIVYILGRDTDAVFYGLLSLDQILDQVVEGKLQKLDIYDYADLKTRGVIEGYYGLPWGWEKRADVLKFASKFKSNVLIFAPKDDPYHRDEWRKLYPEKELEKIGEMAKLGMEYKTRFVWTIAPFHKEPINSDNYDDTIDILKKKLDQLYGVGIRQFGILRDDIGSVEGAEVVSRVMQDLEVWSKTKDEKIYDFLFCPYSYNFEQWAWKPEELDEYIRNFPDGVEIFFTGKNVCSPLEKKDFDDYRIKDISNSRERSKPLMWLNWPVNDVFKEEHGIMSLCMGNPKKIFDTSVDNIIGLVTNPMQEAYASFIGIFASADYSWNIGGYNGDKSYSDSFKYIDPESYVELEELSRHMASVDGTIGIQGLEESEDMKVDIENFEEASHNLDLLILSKTAERLKVKYKNIIDAYINFNRKSIFTGLKKEIEPYIRVLKEKSEAAILFIDATVNIKNQEIDMGKKLFDQALLILDNLKTYKVLASPKGDLRRVEAGRRRINRNIENLEKQLRELLEEK